MISFAMQLFTFEDRLSAPAAPQLAQHDFVRNAVVHLRGRVLPEAADNVPRDPNVVRVVAEVTHAHDLVPQAEGKNYLRGARHKAADTYPLLGGDLAVVHPEVAHGACMLVKGAQGRTTARSPPSRRPGCSTSRGRPWSVYA